MRGLTSRQFRAAMEAAAKAADRLGSRFEDDSPERQVERMARAVVSPAVFATVYLPHYFRDEGCGAHELLRLGLAWEKRLAVRMPRGHGKTTCISFAYTLHQVVCAQVLRAWERGTLAVERPPLHVAIMRAQAEDLAAARARGPLTARGLGLPRHWDVEVDAQIDTWLATVHRRHLAAGAAPLVWDPYIQIVGLTESAACEITAAARRELEGNALLRSDWGELTPCMSGDWTRSVKRSASDADWESNGVRVAAFGLQEGIRGGKHGEWRPSLAIFDDADGEESVRTLNQREGNYRKLAGAVGHGLEPNKGRVLLVGTPHHSDCLAVRLTEREALRARWTGLRVRAADEAGTVLYPAKWSLEALREEQSEPDIYGPELDDRPPTDAARPFHTIHHYARAEWVGQALPKVMAMDTSAARKATSDYQVIVVGRLTPDGRLLVHRAEFGRRSDPLELVAWAQAIHAEEQPDFAVVEAIGVGAIHEALLQSVDRRAALFQGWARIERQEQGKDLRIRGIATPVNGGRILLPDDRSCHQLELQLQRYGESGAKVDGPDTLQMVWAHCPKAGRAQGEVRHGPRRFGDLAEARLDAGPHDTRSDRELRRSLGVW